MNKVIVLRGEPQALALWNLLKANWRAMAADGRPLAVQISEHKAKRNADQNKLYWCTLRDIASQAWIDGKQFSENAWHAYFAAKFIGCEDTPDGRQIPISTTTLSVGEFAAYVTNVQAYAAGELGVTSNG